MTAQQENHRGETHDAPVISVLIINYNTREMTLDCLRSVISETKPGLVEVIVVDNASTDGSAAAIAAAFPEIALYELETNIGFGRANNVAAKLARGRYLLLLNPDTVVLDRGIEKLLAFAERVPEAGIWGGQTLFGDGRLNPTSCWGHMTLWSLFSGAVGLSSLFSATRLFNPEGYGGWKRDSEREVGIVTGCFFLIERAFWDRLGGFDPRFFMYAEEADLCWRAAELGARPRITPEARIVHYGGGSEPVRSTKLVWLLKGNMSVIRKHWSRPWRWIACRFIELHVVTRWMGYAVVSRMPVGSARSERWRKSAAQWKAVWQARAEWRAGYPPFDGSALPSPVPYPS